MFLEHVSTHLAAVERNHAIADRTLTITALRPLGLEDFGRVLWSMPSQAYPRLSNLLPSMTPPEVTRKWTGAEGLPLLVQSLSFVRACADNFCHLTGETLRGKRILDFGCGYGRFLRLFSFYSLDIRGVDAWDASLSHCIAAGLGDLVARSDAIPVTLPVHGRFDFVFSFSVFTHLSMSTALASLKALRSVTKAGGILVITIRPVEFWSFAKKGILSSRFSDADKMEEQHRCSGFAFLPHDKQATREATYGDTSVSLEWLTANIDGWKIEAVDGSTNDVLQRYVFLKAV